MARLAHKSPVEEIGQRTARSASVYLPKGGNKETAYCRGCGVLYRNKRWVVDPAEVESMKRKAGSSTLVCPACKRMEDDNPAGIVTLKGNYLVEHEEEILNVLKHLEATSRVKNPLGRIMEIRQEKNVMTIATTDDKLAQKLGHEIYKAHKGELNFQWAHDQEMVRVTWSR